MALFAPGWPSRNFQQNAGTEMLQARMRFHGKVGVIWGTIWTLLEALSCSSPREWQDRVWCWGLEVIAGDRRRTSTEPE